MGTAKATAFGAVFTRCIHIVAADALQSGYSDVVSCVGKRGAPVRWSSYQAWSVVHGMGKRRTSVLVQCLCACYQVCRDYSVIPAPRQPSVGDGTEGRGVLDCP